MTGLGWAALAGVLLLLPSAESRPARVSRLAAGRRLAGGDRVVRGPRWSVPRAVLPAGVVVGAGLAAVLVAPAWGVAGAVAGGAAVAGLRGRAGRRAAASARGELRTGLAALTAELAAGGRPDGALAAAAAAGPRHEALFARAARMAADGGDAAAVLEAAPATRALGCAWRLGERTGAGLAAVLARVSADLEQEEQQRRAVAVALAGPQASATVLAGLPVLGLLLGAAMGGHPLAFLVGTRAGSLVGATGVLLDVAGLAWLRAILRRADPS